ncbi:related to MNR2 - manganese resistance protein [Cephalotrichum gorgonifer]|uniref:Related to MNR2 - manganese resistance protein n=1 Tax=Cephalotrichum gorgonifer TaxID=2041049 RepID=A0AAE8MQA2_9PEZI|nr:related to MNR2 - manganese resistance protein [Cephalotrichum gorgonifer]
MSDNPFTPLSTIQDMPDVPILDPDTEAPPVASPARATASSSKAAPGRRKKHRGGRKKRTRRESFAPLQEESNGDREPTSARDVARESLYDLQRNLSSSSLNSEALTDSRGQRSSSPPLRTHTTSSTAQARMLRSPSFVRQNTRRRPSLVNPPDRDLTQWDETSPLISSSNYATRGESAIGGSGINPRRESGTSSLTKPKSAFDVNYPPSVPGTPTLGPVGTDMSFGDVLIRDKLARDESPGRLSLAGDEDDTGRRSRSPSARKRSTGSPRAEDAARYLAAELSEVAEEDAYSATGRTRPRRRRRTPWPDLAALEAWRNYEKEQEASRSVKRITEPQLINGRLRAVHKSWYRSDDELPYRFTYFNEDLQSTIHSQTISGLIQSGGSFRELFIPDPRVLSDDESEEEEEWGEEEFNPFTRVAHNSNESLDDESKSPLSPPPTRHLSAMSTQGNGEAVADAPGRPHSGTSPAEGPTPAQHHDGEPKRTSPPPFSKPAFSASPDPTGGDRSPKYGDRPVWWLDVLSPTEAEMKIISQAFGIHPLTAEDIMVQEAREKVELFHNYYFVNYRTFDQDPRSGTHMGAVNMYSVVFREGIITFHFSITPHSANVRRRIRQLKDYLIVSSDWISYAIIDDITDVFGPIIQNIEEEVDDIDEAIMSTWDKKEPRDDENEKVGGDDTMTAELSGGDVLRRVSDCRKRVMSLYRLLGNKADVIKGFAKRCNEQYKVTPHSDIGLYLGDIQDHIVTMTSNLSHYEKILARAHGNYLAHINCRMTERSEATADSLNKLTVLGTIVLPMNIITGLWGMNVWVPGQESEGNLVWFTCITLGLVAFGFCCYFTAKRVYSI